MTPPRPRLPPLPTAFQRPPNGASGVPARVARPGRQQFSNNWPTVSAISSDGCGRSPCVDAQENSHDRDADGQ